MPMTSSSPKKDLNILLSRFERELNNVLLQKEKDYTKASKALNKLIGALLDSEQMPEDILDKLYKLCRKKNQIELLVINFPKCPTKKDGSEVSIEEIYSQDFNAVYHYEDLLKLETTQGQTVDLDLEKLLKEKDYLISLEIDFSLTQESLNKLHAIRKLENLDGYLKFVSKFDPGDLFLFNRMDEQVEIAKMKKRAFSSKGLTVDLTTADIENLNPKMAALLTRVTTFCHWGTRGQEHLIFAQSKENVQDLSDAFKDETKFKNLNRFTILGCATTSKLRPQIETARLVVYNGLLHQDLLDNLNNMEYQDPSYVWHIDINHHTQKIKLCLLKLPCRDGSDELFNQEIDIREYYKNLYNALPPKSRNQAPKPEGDISKIIGYVKNAINMISPKNTFTPLSVSPKQINPAWDAFKLTQIHKIIFKDSAKGMVNEQPNIYLLPKKKKGLLFQKEVIKENQEMLQRFQEGTLSKEERKILKSTFPSLKTKTVELPANRVVSQDTLDLAALAELTINSQRLHTPVEVKGYTVPVTKAAKGEGMIVLNSKVLTEILEEKIPKAVVLRPAK